MRLRPRGCGARDEGDGARGQKRGHGLGRSGQEKRRVGIGEHGRAWSGARGAGSQDWVLGGTLGRLRPAAGAEIAKGSGPPEVGGFAAQTRPFKRANRGPPVCSRTPASSGGADVVTDVLRASTLPRLWRLTHLDFLLIKRDLHHT